MKTKKIIIIAVLFLSSTYLKGQSTFDKGTRVLNIGLGFGNYWYYGNHWHQTVPSISVSFEKSIIDGIGEKGSIGIGGIAGFSAYRWDDGQNNYNYTNVLIGARGAFHYEFVDKLDTYVGLMLGYSIATHQDNPNYNGTVGGFGFTAYLGARYYFNPKFAAMMELGYGISSFNVGIAIKL
jgi:hypothetical protein